MTLKPLDLSEDAPWKKRFRAPTVAWSQIAQNNPNHALVCTNRDGVMQLYGWRVDTAELHQLTNDPAGIVAGTISADGNRVYYLKDEMGNEIGRFVSIPFEGGEEETLFPELVDPYSSLFFSENGAESVLGFTTADEKGFTAYIQKRGEALKVLFSSPHITFGPQFSHGGEIAVIGNTARSGTIEPSLIAFNLKTGDQIAELWDGEGSGINLGSFSPLAGDLRLYATSSKSGYDRPLIWNPLTNERRDLKLDDIEGQVNVWSWSADAKKLLLCQLHQAQYQLFLYHLEDDSVTKLDHPEGSYTGGYLTAEGEIFTTWEHSAQPAQLVALDGKSGCFKRTLLGAAEIPPGKRWESFTYTSENGGNIQGWLVTPDGKGPFPTILHVHGGPTSVTTDKYLPESQAWVDHGFAFCSINYHGSITFGTKFEKAIWGNLGDLEMGDMAAAYQYLIENGIAQPDAVLLTGGSYGGYLTLQALGRRPELWAGGMASIAIADWGLLYEDQAETLRGYQRALFGGTPAETPEATRKSSPLTYAAAVAAPLLVIQGENDTRCPPRQMVVYEEKLKSMDKPIEVHWFEAGHGSRAQEQQIEHQELNMRFAYRVLG